MNDTQPEKPKRGVWIWLAILGVSLAAALSVATSLGWGNGPVVAALLVLSTVVSLAIAVFREHLPTGSRGQAAAVTGVVLLVFGVVLGASWMFGREEPAVIELQAPTQRTVTDVRSECGTPDAAALIGDRPSRIVTTRAAQGSAEGGDFVAALVSGAAVEERLGEASLVVLTCADAGWQQSMSRMLPLEGCGYDLLTAQLRSVDREEVVLSGWCGSGAYLDISVIGESDGSEVGTLYQEEGLFQGVVSQVGDHLLLAGGGGRAEIAWNGERLERVDKAGSVPASEGVFVDFWWDAQGGGSDLTDVLVDVGETVHFRWDRARSTDDSVTSYRLLASGPECPSGEECPTVFADGEPGEDVLTLPGPGLEVEVSIVPNGYDWEQAITVTLRS